MVLKRFHCNTHAYTCICTFVAHIHVHVRICTCITLDGCSRENTTSESLTLQWPETNLGDISIISCPCGNIDLSSTGLVATRECVGSFDEEGAMWGTLDASKCQFSEITRQMCELASVS